VGRLKRDVGGLGDLQDRLVAGALLPGGADGFDSGLVLGGVGVVDDEELGADALGIFFGVAGFVLPLPVDVENAEAGGKARRDLGVEEVTPGGLGDAFVGGVSGTQAEVEAGVDPAGGLRGVHWLLGVAGEDSGFGVGREELFWRGFGDAPLGQIPT
jgi:hypothetical protein